MRSKLAVLPWVILLLPLDLIVAIGIAITQIVSSPPQLRRGGAKASGLARRARSARAIARSLKTGAGQTTEFLDQHHPSQSSALAFPSSVEEGSRPNTTIVIVNWDGKHLLAECLPSVIEAVNYAGGNHEILVVDNGSTDGSVKFTQEHFPGVRTLALSRNYGFAGGNNRAIQEVRTNIVIFLNNDMVVDREFLRPLLKGFQDESVFAVTSQIFFADRARTREETGKTRARFEQGFFYFWHDEILPNEQKLENIPVFWAGGGSCAIDVKKFLAIGGFDSLYAPFYVEDADLSYQAWKRGWKCLLAPASRVTHKHRSTSNAKFGERFVNNTTRRNTYLFIWKNLTDASLVFDHLLNLPRTHTRAMIQNGPLFELQAFVRAVLHLPAALAKRIANTSRYAISDREVLARSQR
jgi:O-antigen biosynthesis protein